MSKRKGSGRADPSSIFVKHTMEMLQSEAWRQASPRVLKLLSCIELKNMAAPTNQNGWLSATYAELRAFGVGAFEVIAKAINDAERLGFLEVTFRGERRGRKPLPSRYRLTYVPTKDAPPTNEWKSRFESRSTPLRKSKTVNVRSPLRKSKPEPLRKSKSILPS